MDYNYFRSAHDEDDRDFPPSSPGASSPVPAKREEQWRMELAQLLRRLQAHAILVAPGAERRLLAYVKSVAEHAAPADLVSLKDLPFLVTKHVAASLGPLLLVSASESATWIDAGTGGGLPGMVLKLARPELAITLLDSSHKKTAFLERFARQQSLDGPEIICQRMEAPLRSAIGGEPAHYDVVVMRAVAALEKSLPWATALTRSGGRFLTFKGPHWERELQAASARMEAGGWRFAGMQQIPWAQPKLLCFIKS